MVSSVDGLIIDSTLKVPTLTEQQIDTFPNCQNGMIVFNTTIKKLQIYIDVQWVNLH